MVRRTQRVAIALGLSVALFAGSSVADEKSAVAAKKEFSAGEKAFDKSDFVEALDHFKKAYELAPRDAVHFNIGVCLEKLGRYKEALAEYEAAAKSSELDAQKLERAASEAERVRGRLGKLQVEVTPPGGELFVDGARVCELPCEVLLDPRSHEIIVKKGSAEKSRSVTLASGETTRIEIELGATDRPTQPPAQRRDEKPRTESGGGPGALTWIGAGVAVVGTGAFVGFYLRTKSLEREYADTGEQDTRDEGKRMGLFTNVSLGVAVVGVGLVALDLLVLSKGRSSSAKHEPFGTVRF